MKAAEYDKMYRAETRFWWFVGKGLLLTQWAAKWLEPEGEYLDVGCGTGANLELVQDRGSWIGVDASSDAIGFCAARGHDKLVHGKAGRLPFGDGSFDGAIALDLFEHLETDKEAAAEILRVLRPGGILIVTVPAHPFLWGAHDLALGHLRRYRGAHLRKLLGGAGFSVLRMTHFMGFLFPAMVLVRLWQKRFGDEADTISYQWPGWINGLLGSIVSLEVKLLKLTRMPAGTTLAAVARKPPAGADD